MTAARYFHDHVDDGRAVIFYRPLDEAGQRDPMLWFCRMGETLVACDDAGPNTAHERDEGFVLAIPPQTTVQDVVTRWKRHRTRILVGRLQRRRRAA